MLCDVSRCVSNVYVGGVVDVVECVFLLSGWIVSLCSGCVVGCCAFCLICDV